MSEQFIKSEDDWVIETLLIEAHNIIHNYSKGLVFGLCEPQDGIRIVYPPRPPLSVADLEKLTHQEIEGILSGQLSEAEILAIRSMEIDSDDVKKQILEKTFVEYFSRLFFDWLNLFDGARDPRLIEFTGTAWLGARILSFSSEEQKSLLMSANPENFLASLSNHDKPLQDKFADTYHDFNKIISAEPYTQLKIKDFDSDDIVIKTLLIEAYCEIEVTSRQLVKDLSELNLTFVYPLNENGTKLTESEKKAISSIGLQDEAIKAVLQKVFAAYCYDVVSMWLSAFDPNYSSITIYKQQDKHSKIWWGAKISASGYRYPEMLHDAFYDLRYEFDKIISQPLQRPF